MSVSVCSPDSSACPRKRVNLKQRSIAVDQDDIARLSPLGHDHIRFHGNYSFTLSQEIRDGQLMPLRHGIEDL